MARQRIKITYDDGKETIVKVTPKVEVQVEAHYGEGLGELGKQGRAENVYRLAWIASKAAGDFTFKDFDDFLEHLEDVEMLANENGETPLDAPLEKEPGQGNSSS